MPPGSGAPEIRTSWPGTFLLLPASLHRRAVPEEAPGSEHQHQDQHREDHDRRPPDAYVLVSHGPDDAEQESPYHRPGQVADAPENSCRERVEPLLEAYVEDRDAVEESIHHARGPGQDASKEECYRYRSVNVDADHRRRLLVLGDGPHRLPLLGVGYEVGERHEQGYRHQDDEEVLPAEDDGVSRQDVGAGDELGERDLGWPFPYQPEVLEDKRHADGRDQDRQPRRVAQRLVRHTLDPHAKQPAGDHRHHHRDDHPEDADEGPGIVSDRSEETET